jgi:hypothetical protein
MGERHRDSGVYDDIGTEQCEQRQNHVGCDRMHVGCDRMKAAFEDKPGRNNATL